MATIIQQQPDGIDSWVYPLRNFIDEATRYKIEGVYNTVQPDSKFSTLFEDYVRNGRNNFERFKKELREKLSQSVNPDIILKDIRGEFELMINQYKRWYEENKTKTEIFEPYNPYRLMFELVLSTEKEIEKYSPKSKPGRKVKIDSKLTFNKLFRPEYRTYIPDEVIRLLGTGEADAWEMKNNKKEWVYKDPESAIMIPFYYLCEKKYIEIPSRKKNEFITVWLKEFGKEYKQKTFDKPPQDYEATEYFKEYLNKLK